MRRPLMLDVVPLDNRRLRIRMGNGSLVELNLEDRLGTVRFCPLQDDEVFCSVTLDDEGSCLLFGEQGRKLTLGASEIMQLAVMPCGKQCEPKKR